MAFFGLQDEIADAPTEEEVEQECYEIWRDNVPTLNLFLALKNQWHVVAAPDGEMVRTGIRRSAIEFELKHTNGFPRRKWPAIFADLRAMEDVALGVMNKARAERRKKRQEESEAKQRKS